jgi:transcriptional regulator with XRE-family HTH domain
VGVPSRDRRPPDLVVSGQIEVSAAEAARMVHLNALDRLPTIDEAAANEVRERFGRALKTELVERGWSQKNFGELLGLSQAQVSEWVRGTANVTLGQMLSADACFGRPAGYLLWRCGLLDLTQLGDAVENEYGTSTRAPRRFEEAIAQDTTLDDKARIVVLRTLADQRRRSTDRFEALARRVDESTEELRERLAAITGARSAHQSNPDDVDAAAAYEDAKLEAALAQDLLRRDREQLESMLPMQSVTRSGAEFNDDIAYRAPTAAQPAGVVHLPDPEAFKAMVVAVKEALGEEFASQREEVAAHVREEVLALFREAGTPVVEGARSVTVTFDPSAIPDVLPRLDDDPWAKAADPKNTTVTAETTGAVDEPHDVDVDCDLAFAAHRAGRTFDEIAKVQRVSTEEAERRFKVGRQRARDRTPPQPPLPPAPPSRRPVRPGAQPREAKVVVAGPALPTVDNAGYFNADVAGETDVDRLTTMETELLKESARYDAEGRNPTTDDDSKAAQLKLRDVRRRLQYLGAK